MAELLKSVLDSLSVGQPKYEMSVSPIETAGSDQDIPGANSQSSSMLDNPQVQKILPMIEAAQRSENSMTQLIEDLKQLDPAQLLPLLDILETLQQKGFLNKEFMSKLLNSKLQQMEQQFFGGLNRESSIASDGESSLSPTQLTTLFSPSSNASTPLTSQINGNSFGSGTDQSGLEPQYLNLQSPRMNGGKDSWKPGPQVDLTIDNENKLKMSMGYQPTSPPPPRYQELATSENFNSCGPSSTINKECHSSIPAEILSLHPASQSSRSVSPLSPFADLDNRNEHRSKDSHVTSSGRNRGLGRANEPKFFCQVCGDIAAGFHCGAYVCEACKKFYLRCLKNGQSLAYACPKTQSCEISKETRSHCQFCRYQKCVRLGMYKPGRDDSKHLRVDFKSIPCKVCGACSSGFHFGAITCEGCKGFFRRMVKEQLHKKFVCATGGSCEVASDKRTSCKACRFNKCVSVGMALQGTRLGRQSNSVKRTTLIQYKDSHGMDVALYPKIAKQAEESQMVATKVRRLLSQGSDTTVLPIKQETMGDAAEFGHKTLQTSMSVPGTSSSFPVSPPRDSDFPWVDDVLLSNPDMGACPASHEKKSAFDWSSSGLEGSDLLPASSPPRGGPGSMSGMMVNSELLPTTATSATAAQDVFRLPFPSSSFLISPATRNMVNILAQPVTSSPTTTANPPTPKSLTQWPSIVSTGDSSQGSGNDGLCSISIVPLPSPTAESSQPAGEPGHPRTVRAALLKSERSSQQLAKCLMEKMSQHVIDTTLPNKPIADLRLIRRRNPSGVKVISLSDLNLSKDEVEKHHKAVISIEECFKNTQQIREQVVTAYRELENIQLQKRSPLNKEPQIEYTEKRQAWLAAYESFMHLTKYTLKFVKKCPCFRDLLMDDQITLVRESTYPVNLLFHAQFIELFARENRWYCNSTEEKAVIVKHFPKFQILWTHLEYVGQIVQRHQPSLEEYAFLCAIVLFTIDSFLVKDHILVDKIQTALTDAFIAYSSETSGNPNRPGLLLLRLAELRRANFEHTQIAMDVQHENPDVNFQQLWCEMFLSNNHT